MPPGYPARAYQSTEAATADPRHLVVLLFDTMVRKLGEARAAMVEARHHDQCQAILHTQRILNALMAALDRAQEPEFTGGLFALYNWLHARLTEASVADDTALLDEVAGHIGQLRDAWRQAEVNCRQEEQTAHEATPAAVGSTLRSAA